MLLMLHLIRVRLRAKDPELYAKLGNPAFNDSNLGPTYWRFQGFIWRRHFSDTHDDVLHTLCLLATLSQLAIIVLFVMQFWVAPSPN